ncbi:Zn(II)2Cys6 transcription factor [Aspergillus stella-maris]|uniref:Zn(II)2Cys6 transcription factor n=1 Tax=Aspergillus stella-maris TaxID=1810926 RepID=UPI003CCDDE13
MPYDYTVQPPPTARGLRSRTGCLTCRRRRKKCDENRPRCHNCVRNNLCCEGYQSQQRWSPGRSQRRRQASPGAHSEPSASPSCSSPSISIGSPEQLQPEIPTGAGTQLALRSTSLPSLIPGVQTPIERQLFHHFTAIFMPTLALDTTSSSKNALAAAIIIPLAVADGGVLDLALSVSASHLLRRLPSDYSTIDPSTYRDITQTAWRRLSNGTRFHYNSIQKLSGESDASQNSQISTALITAIARTMLLCQHDTCLGGFDGTWKIHLTAARKLLSLLQETRANQVEKYEHRALIDWVKYHDLLARVTDPNMDPETKLQDPATGSEDSSARDTQVTLIGPQDGLFSILRQILNLHHCVRALARSGSSPEPDDLGPCFDVLQEGLRISAELEAWSFDYPFEQQRIVGECYRWACFILLHATVYSSSVNDPTIQSALAGGLTFLERLDGTANAQTCALYPMFVFGMSAVTEHDQDLVRRKLDQYHQWAGLGNIEETKKLLEQWWERNRDGTFCVSWWSWEDWAAAKGLQPMIA